MLRPGKNLYLNEQDLIKLKKLIFSGKKIFEFTARGRSMYPFFRSGDILKVAATNFNDIKIGEVIFFCKNDSNLAVHRVIRKVNVNNQLRLITKGDFASTIDEAIDEKNFIGKVIGIKNRNGSFLYKLGLNKKLGFIIARLSILYGFILYILRGAKKHLYINFTQIKNSKSKKIKYKFEYRQDLIKAINYRNIDKSILFSREKWQQILGYARLEGVSGILYNDDKGSPRISTFVLNQIKETHISILTDNLILQNELKNFLSETNKLGIDIMLLKGIALINSGIYSDLGNRPMSDIDLLLRPQDLSKVRDILIKQGYRSGRSTQISFVKQLGHMSILIELHSDVFLTAGEYDKEKFSSITNDFWKRKERIEIDGRAAYILSPEDLLLYQVSHIALGEAWLRLIWLYDIKAIADFYKERLNWDLFLERARNYNLNIPLYFVLNYSRQFFSTDIPDFVIEKLKPAKKELLKAKIISRLLRNNYVPNLFRLIYFLIIPRISEKISILGRGIFPPVEFFRRRYGINSRRQILYYYLMRPFLGLTKGMKIVLGLLKLGKR